MHILIQPLWRLLQVFRLSTLPGSIACSLSIEQFIVRATLASVILTVLKPLAISGPEAGANLWRCFALSASRKIKPLLEVSPTGVDLINYLEFPGA